VPRAVPVPVFSTDGGATFRQPPSSFWANGYCRCSMRNSGYLRCVSSPSIDRHSPCQDSINDGTYSHANMAELRRAVQCSRHTVNRAVLALAVDTGGDVYNNALRQTWTIPPTLVRGWIAWYLFYRPLISQLFYCGMWRHAVRTPRKLPFGFGRAAPGRFAAPGKPCRTYAPLTLPYAGASAGATAYACPHYNSPPCINIRTRQIPSSS